MSLPRYLSFTGGVAAVFLLSHCGGEGGAGGPLTVNPPTDHVPALVTCGAHTTPPPPDGGAMSCSTDTDCQGTSFPSCRAGTCQFDACVTSDDCASGTTCGCSDMFNGNAAYHPNQCLPSNCRVDADCGGGGYCSPTVSSSCGPFYGVTGFYCHTSADTCENDSDCPATSPAGYCAYDPSVGHWACGSGFCGAG
jgi:hypothetical protein